MCVHLALCLLLCGLSLCDFFFVKVSRQVKLELQDSEYFHVVGPEESKVAPGLSATFTVSFTPQENKVLETDRSVTAP